jgi:hypothetical protein
MTTTYRYAIENEHGAVRDVTEGEAEHVRTGYWRDAADLPDGTQVATGCDKNCRPVKVYRIEE